MNDIRPPALPAQGRPPYHLPPQPHLGPDPPPRLPRSSGGGGAAPSYFHPAVRGIGPDTPCPGSGPPGPHGPPAFPVTACWLCQSKRPRLPFLPSAPRASFRAGPVQQSRSRLAWAVRADLLAALVSRTLGLAWSRLRTTRRGLVAPPGDGLPRGASALLGNLTTSGSSWVS